MLIYLGYKFVEFLVFATPYPVTYFIADTVATILFFCGTHVHILKKNVALALDIDIKDKKTSRIVWRIYINWYRNIADFLKLPKINNEQLKKRIELHGLDNLRGALKEEKGAILFTAHIGNFEWGGCRVAIEGFKITGVGLERPYKKTNLFFENRRRTRGMGTLYANKRELNIIRILKSNEALAIPTEFDPLKKAKEYEFFNKKAFIPSGPVELALKTGAALLPSFIWRKDKYNHYLIIGEPLKLERDEGKFAGKTEFLEYNMKKMTEVMEKYIKEHIEEWEMFHDIWA
jgi:Kdo2-lipid IVA lauroyltransferase/acyltransferase